MGTFQLTITGGNMILNSTMLLTGTNTNGISMNTLGGTITTGGHILQVVLTLAGSLTFTLADNLNTNSRIRCAVTTINSNQINLLDNSQFVVVTTNSTCLGSTLINITGNNVSIGADTTSLNTGININITINSSGTVTFRQDNNTGGGAFGFGAKTFTYTAGTLVFNCAYIRLVTAGTATFNFGSQTIPGLRTVVGSITINTTGTLNVAGDTQLIGSTVISGSISTYSLTPTSTGQITGAGSITMNGTGTWSQSSTARINCNLIINTSGVVTISGTVYFDSATLTYTAGSVITTGSSLGLSANSTFNTNGMTFNNIFINGTTLTQITINSTLSFSGSLTLVNQNLTLSGTSGVRGGSLILTTSILTSAKSLTLLQGIEYYFTNITITGASNTLRYTIKSNSAGNQTKFTLSPGGTQNIGYTNGTDVDSSLGQTIYSFNAVLSNTINWNTLIQPVQQTFTFQH